MTKDMILHTMTKKLVRNWRTRVLSAAHSSSLTGALTQRQNLCANEILASLRWQASKARATSRWSRDYVSLVTKLRLVISLLLFLTVGSGSVWGQDYSGTYYIGNYNNNGYNVETPANNYYLVPAADPKQSHQIDAYYSANYGSADGDPNQPFLTTYKTNKDANSVWILEASGESGFYYIKHQSTGRYVIYDPVFPGDNSRRKSMHLTTSALDDKAKFAITVSKPGYAIRPKSVSTGNRYFNVAGGNIDFYYSNGPTTGTATYYNGLVGLYSDAADKNGIWYLEIPKPVISQDPTTLKISMSCDLTGVDIRYTTNGTEPTKTSTLYEGEFLPEIGTSVFKAKAFNSSGDVASAMTTFELTKNAAPTISLNWNDKQVTISSTVEGGTIFYTTNGNNPTVSSSVYSSVPISFSKPTTFKAIVGKEGYAPSTVTTRDVIKVVTPTIYDNGNVAIAITTATTGASIYYTTDGSTPTRSSSPYSAPLTNMEGKTIKAFAVKANNFDSDVATYGPVSFSCAQPIIRRTGADNFTITCSKPQSGVTIYYTTNGSTPSTSDSHVASGEAVTFNPSQLPFTVKAIAVADGFTNSSEASLTITSDGLSGSGTPADPYQIALNSDYSIFATKVNTGGEASACYIITSDINASGAAEITTPFTGTFDGNGYTISNLGHALFNTVSGGTVKNVILDAVGISSGTNVGSIANEAIGTSANKASIYNCGVLSGSISGSGYVGSIVGKLGDDSNNDNSYARVINCYSYATIGGGSSVGGIVGYNSFASAANNLRTMVMNCMFYGKITGGSNKAPIYNGQNITNVGTNGLANYNYYFSGCTFTGGIDTYNCALAADERYLTRFEFYRRMLNSNGELAAWYATGSTENRSEMYKWILLPSSYGTEHPFPVLAPQGIYPSVVNIDAENAEDMDDNNEHRNEGRKLTNMGGTGTHKGQLAVTIQMGSQGNAPFGAPSGAGLKSGETFPIYLNITDKDYEHFNYNYGKVQLPYYNDYCTGNYTVNRVVTGWKIVSITGGTAGNYSTGADVTFTNGELTATPYNFADRKCTNKDLYSQSGRIFSQGAYWDVPEGVTAITIEPYWGKAAYLCDQYWNVVYSADHKTAFNVTNIGSHYTNGTDYFIEGTWQKVYNSLDNAVNALSSNASHSVYDYAVVLVGNYHLVKQGASINSGAKPFTVMSADFDNDNEPDYSFILQFSSRQNTAPIRFDFINIPGLGMAQKSYGAQSMPNVGIFKPGGCFEITNTATILLGQFEYDRSARVNSPLILHGGIIEQIVSNNDGSTPLSHTQYIHMGSNVWLANFSPGIHQDRKTATKHVPVSVTGGEYEEFHLTGMYRADADIYDDNAECYIHGGKFGEITGTGLEGIGHPTNHTNGNITWVIDRADITNFFGGGINAAKPSQGNIYTEITNSNVTLFCGGPKFGDMQGGKTVTTKATDCVFGTFFGAGYGGNSYNRFSPTNKTNAVNYEWNTWVNEHYTCNYSSDADKNGISTNFDYEFIPMSGGMTTNVARLFVNYLSFSLATTGNVTSTLTGCKVTGNFYGGGSLGKVNGNVTSTLTNCTLEQNAFGAGFSATLPTVDVMNTGGFTTEPEYDPDGGVYSQGVFPGTTTYTWKQAASPSIDKKNSILYTTADLTTLGTITGNVALTIDGSTTVNGNVYGGGEESNVNGNTNVNICAVQNGTGYSPEAGSPVISGNVFGGGKGLADSFKCLKAMIGVVDSNDGNTDISTEETNKGTKVIIGNGTVNGSVYGGGEVGRVEWNTVVKVGLATGTSAPVIGNDVFGAGKGVEQYGYAALVRGNTFVTIDGGAKVGNSVYGGGEIASVGKYSIATAAYAASHPEVEEGMPYSLANSGSGFCNVTVKGNAEIGPDGMKMTKAGGPDDAGHVFGAGKGILPYENKDNYECQIHKDSEQHGLKHPGRMAPGGTDGNGVWECYEGRENDYLIFIETQALATHTEVTIDGNAFVKGSVYGGSMNGHVQHDTHVTIAGGQIGCGRGMTTRYSDEDFSGESLNPVETWEYKWPYAPYDQYAVAEERGVNEENVRIYKTYYDNAKTKTAEQGWTTASDGHTYYGNVFGGGSGVIPYAAGQWHRAAGSVGGNTRVDITGGHILANVYGGNEQTDVGTYKKDAGEMTTTPADKDEEKGTPGGLCTINMSGGTVGVPRSAEDIANLPTVGYVYGGGKGDKRVFFNTWTNVINTSVNITGGKIFGGVYGGGEDGHVIENAVTTIGVTPTTENPSPSVPLLGCDGTSGFDGNVFGGGQGSPTALTAGVVGGNVTLNILGGEMKGSVYGGGRIASVGTNFVNPENTSLYGALQSPAADHGNIAVSLTGGTIHQDVYGGGMGTTQRQIGMTKQASDLFNAKLGISRNVTVTLNHNVADNAKGCIVRGNIFGCNNLNASPKGEAQVYIYGTQRAGANTIANPENAENPTAKVAGTQDSDGNFILGSFDVKAVYGGGNMAAYQPDDAVVGQANSTDAAKTYVYIDGCHRTSIGQVYGGGNAASTPATHVEIHGSYEIGEVFGGGNGKDQLPDGSDNPGANVGFFDYSDKESEYLTKADRETEAFVKTYVYGTGKASVDIRGGRIHRVFGGSNTKGNVRKTALTMLADESGCTFDVDEAYGGGKKAPMDAEAKLLMACIPGLTEVYGGAQAADIQGNVTLNITNGKFNRVFGGNNISGTISGAIEINIDEAGCKPVIIGELYAGGNKAPYSVYGYKNIGTANDPEYAIRMNMNDETSISTLAESEQYSEDQLFANPTINVKAFTSIGNIYGGGYGREAVLVGNPQVNINVVEGRHKNKVSDSTDPDYGKTGYMYDENGYIGTDMVIDGHNVIIPRHDKGKIGAIQSVFGGGNAAQVVGNTQVNIGTKSEEFVIVRADLTVGTTDVSNYYIRTGTGTESDPYDYDKVVSGTKAEEGVTYYEKQTVVGADIRDNVYGGGNAAEVTGNSKVVIGQKKGE